MENPHLCKGYLLRDKITASFQTLTILLWLVARDIMRGITVASSDIYSLWKTLTHATERNIMMSDLLLLQ